MKFSIKDPSDGTIIVMEMVPEEHEGEQVLRVIFPEKDSILMIRKNGIWSNATETDLKVELVNAISRGIHAHIRQHQIYRDPVSFNQKNLKDSLYTLLLVAAITLTACTGNKTSKDVDSLMTDSTRIDTASNPVSGVPDTTTIKQDSLHLDTL